MSGILIKTLQKKIDGLNAKIQEFYEAGELDMQDWLSGDAKFDPFQNLRPVLESGVKKGEDKDAT